MLMLVVDESKADKSLNHLYSLALNAITLPLIMLLENIDALPWILLNLSAFEKMFAACSVSITEVTCVVFNLYCWLQAQRKS